MKINILIASVIGIGLAAMAIGAVIISLIVYSGRPRQVQFINEIDAPVEVSSEFGVLRLEPRSSGELKRGWFTGGHEFSIEAPGFVATCSLSAAEEMAPVLISSEGVECAEFHEINP